MPLLYDHCVMVRMTGPEVDLLDLLAQIEGTDRSKVIRGLLHRAGDMLLTRAAVEAKFESAPGQCQDAVGH